ncbi:preprotein translocase subunit SecY [Collinsella tanakaei]|uniref:Protein translocase subunit SecY n=1 Tax=Collinsella ihumii TaxID=1720204 RepID=A0A921LTK5_9ACTN|nr:MULTISPECIES: preprotein translocase subunit SecY [Collinsella]MBM6777011.1 preprotein translocase subunit SecY [Collinsella tanakaei]MBM6784772.1 preprotein translocase subunit SecY [Collinsella tanakaei]MBM6905585.1 preprotein translocase subunit SecY [Collinsella tanakaei]MCF6412129.1 preprotein translocase subunit SecY [Collinsella tanakaei]MDN0069186.1 preprotein translocase subunit SecY [Collinsella ihumii]
MLTGLKNAFRIKELRGKITFTIAMLVLYRLGAHVPVPGIPVAGMAGLFGLNGDNTVAESAMALLNLFSGGALSYVSVFSLGIMPYITSSIILQMLQSVVPSLHELAREGEVGQTKITQYSRYLTLALAILNGIGYLFLFKSFGIQFNGAGAPEVIFDIMIVGTLVAGAMLIMWIGELITQRGIGNGMSLIIFANIMAGLPQAVFASVSDGGTANIILTLVIVVVILCVIPLIVFVERGQRRIPVQYAKRVVGRRIMGGQSTYLPIKVNTAGVIPIIFASALLYFPAQLAVFFPGIDWIQAVAGALSSGWINWVLNVVLIVFFAYFYTSMVFNPDDTAENLKRQGGFIPGVRPGRATANYIKNALNKITLPSAVFLAIIAIVPSIVFSFTGNSLIQAFGGTSILIMVGVVMDTISKVESQLKMYDYDGFFK